MTSQNDVIDLTDSFTLIDHCELANLVIELDDSLSNSPVLRRSSAIKKRTSKIKNAPAPNNSQPSSPEKLEKHREKKLPGFGDCPICWEELGNNPLASTKCGHVYCLKCLEKYLQQVKKCPTCRCVLKGASAYHPLYLFRQ